MRPLAGADQRLDQLERGGVEVRVGLVQQQQLGVVQHGPRDRHPLDHPPRERAQRLARRARTAQLLEQLARRARADAVQAGVEAQVLARRSASGRASARGRAGRPGRAPPRTPRAGARPSTRTSPACGSQQRREDPQQGRLAGAVGAEHDQRLPRCERQRDVRRAPPARRSAERAPRPRPPPRASGARRAPARVPAGPGRSARAPPAPRPRAEQLDRVGVAVDDRLEELLAVLVGGQVRLRPPARLAEQHRQARVGLAEVALRSRASCAWRAPARRPPWRSRSRAG